MVEEELSWIDEVGCQATSEQEREVTASVAQELLDLALEAEEAASNHNNNIINDEEAREDEDHIDDIDKDLLKDVSEVGESWIDQVLSRYKLPFEWRVITMGGGYLKIGNSFDQYRVFKTTFW